MLLRNVPLDVVLPGLSPITPNQAALQTVSADLPPAWDYLQLRFLVQGLTLTNIQEIRLLLNGNPAVKVSGSALDALNQYFGAPAFGSNGSSLLILPLARLGVRSGSIRGNSGPVQTAYAKDLALESSVNAGVLSKSGSGITSVRVEFDLTNTDAGPLSVQIIGRCLPQDMERGGAGLVPRIDRQTVTVTANQRVALSRNGLLYGDPLHTVLFGLVLVPAAGTLSDFTLRYNGTQWLVNRSAANNDYAQRLERSRFPQAGYYVIDPAESGYGDEVLPIGDPGTDLQLEFTPTDSGAVTIYQYGAGFVA
jgi:hypothetical protein